MIISFFRLNVVLFHSKAFFVRAKQEVKMFRSYSVNRRSINKCSQRIDLSRFTCVNRSSLGLKSILKMPGLEPGTSRLGMLASTLTICTTSPLTLFSGAQTWRASPAYNGFCQVTHWRSDVFK